jgi:hypothetical protein
MTLNTNATVPGIGQTRLAGFGDDTPFGPFAAEVTFESVTRVSFVVTKGSMKGNTDAMDYTTVQVRDGSTWCAGPRPSPGRPLPTSRTGGEEPSCPASPSATSPGR